MTNQSNAEIYPSIIETSDVGVGKKTAHRTNKRKSLTQVFSKALSEKEKMKLQDSIASRRKQHKRYAPKNYGPRNWMRYDEEDNVFFLTQMVKLADDGHDRARSINISELQKLASKRFGHNFTYTQAYEKVRCLKNRYGRMLLKTSTGERVLTDDANQEEIYKLCHHLWGGNCGSLKLHLEDDDEPVRLNAERVELCGTDDDSHGLQNDLPGNDMDIGNGALAGIDNIAHSKQEKCADLGHGVAENSKEKTMKPGGFSTDHWEAQSLNGVLKDKHEELLHASRNKFEAFLEETQTKLMTMISNALETRDITWGAAFLHNGGCVEKMLAASILGCSKSVPKHLEDRWQRLRAEELKLLSERLNLMLEVCRLEQENVETLIRQSH